MSESAYLPVFYCDPLPESQRWELGGDEGHHAAKVRRIRVGERVRIADGAGNYADCVAETVGLHSLHLRVERRGSDPGRTPRIVVIQALPKADRGALAVELLTEIGVDQIVPWQAHHSIARWDGKEDKARARWAAIAREASKQSRRSRVPDVGELVVGVAVAEICRDAQAVVLHESAESFISDVTLHGKKDVVLVVGPEGGISPAELDALDRAGAQVARLGPEVLRTSTAGLAAATWASIALGRWGSDGISLEEVAASP